VLLLVMVAAGGGAFVLLRRWRARGAESNAAKRAQKSTATGDESKKLEARLDAELKALDE
jgi:hypothetical protein